MDGKSRNRLGGFVLLVAILFGAILGAVAIVSMTGDRGGGMDFRYEGFD